MMKRAVALIFGVMLSHTVMAAPATLTEQQMDAVTAGLSVEAKSIAVAIGRYTDTVTDTKVVAEEGEQFSVGWGFTKGFATARGRNDEGDGPKAESRSWADGEADIVKKYRGGFKRRIRHGQSAWSWAFVVAVDVNVDVSELSRWQRLMLHRKIRREISNLTKLARRGKLL